MSHACKGWIDVEQVVEQRSVKNVWTHTTFLMCKILISGTKIEADVLSNRMFKIVDPKYFHFSVWFSFLQVGWFDFLLEGEDSNFETKTWARWEIECDIRISDFDANTSFYFRGRSVLPVGKCRIWILSLKIWFGQKSASQQLNKLFISTLVQFSKSSWYCPLKGSSSEF